MSTPPSDTVLPAQAINWADSNYGDLHGFVMVPEAVEGAIRYGDVMEYRLYNLRPGKQYNLIVYDYASDSAQHQFRVVCNGVEKGLFTLPADLGLKRTPFSGLTGDANGELLVRFEAVNGLFPEVKAFELSENDSDFSPLVPHIQSVQPLVEGVRVNVDRALGFLTYEYRRKAVGAADYETLATGADAVWTDVGVRAGYVYSVRAKSPNGKRSDWSADHAIDDAAANPFDRVAMWTGADAVVDGVPHFKYTKFTALGNIGEAPNQNVVHEHVAEPAAPGAYQAFFHRNLHIFHFTNLVSRGTYRFRIHFAEVGKTVFDERSFRFLLQGLAHRCIELQPVAEMRNNHAGYLEYTVQASANGEIFFRGQNHFDGAGNLLINSIDLTRVTGLEEVDRAYGDDFTTMAIGTATKAGGDVRVVARKADGNVAYRMSADGTSFLGAAKDGTSQDAVLFGRQMHSGNFEMTVRLTHIQSQVAGEPVGVGLMLRDSLDATGGTFSYTTALMRRACVNNFDPNNNNAEIPITSTTRSRIKMEVKTIADDNFSDGVNLRTLARDGLDTDTAAFPAAGTVPGTRLPVWLRVRRTMAGGRAVLESFQSADGVTWTRLGEPLTVGCCGKMFAGVAMCGGADPAAVVEFDRVSVTESNGLVIIVR